MQLETSNGWSKKVSFPQSMKEDEPEKFEGHFATYTKAGVTGEELEEMYKKVGHSLFVMPIKLPLSLCLLVAAVFGGLLVIIYMIINV